MTGQTKHLSLDVTTPARCPTVIAAMSAWASLPSAAIASAARLSSSSVGACPS